jgi:hypothetical protein
VLWDLRKVGSDASLDLVVFHDIGNSACGLGCLVKFTCAEHRGKTTSNRATHEMLCHRDLSSRTGIARNRCFFLSWSKETKPDKRGTLSTRAALLCLHRICSSSYATQRSEGTVVESIKRGVVGSGDTL